MSHAIRFAGATPILVSETLPARRGWVPSFLGRSIDARTTIHAVTGLIGVVLGLFIAIRANQLAAKGQSLRRYKNTMRAAYGVYLLGTALGVWVYVALYG